MAEEITLRDSMGIEVIANTLTYHENQSSARILARTGLGNCFAYAKLELINDELLELYVQRDADAGLHFGAVDTSQRYSSKPLLHHLRNIHPNTVEMEWSEELTEAYYTSDRAVHMLRPQPFSVEKVYKHSKDPQRTTALIFSREPFLFLTLLGEHYDETNPWKSVLTATEEHGKISSNV